MKKIAVMSGKGGVGKSIVTALLGKLLSEKGRVGILDADVTGPSIPLMFGAKSNGLQTKDKKMIPVTKDGIKLTSVGFLLEKSGSAVIWRGPLISKMIGQLLNETEWGELDFLLIDLPPGTSDAALTTFQMGLDGVIIVMTPQEIVVSDVVRAISMSKKMNVPILGIVENMAFVECPHCKKKINVFGESKAEKIAEENKIKNVVKIPLDEKISKLADEGKLQELTKMESVKPLKKIVD